jgi:hypothetical protein
MNQLSVFTSATVLVNKPSDFLIFNGANCKRCETVHFEWHNLQMSHSNDQLTYSPGRFETIA